MIVINLHTIQIAECIAAEVETPATAGRVHFSYYNYVMSEVSRAAALALLQDEMKRRESPIQRAAARLKIPEWLK